MFGSEREDKYRISSFLFIFQLSRDINLRFEQKAVNRVQGVRAPHTDESSEITDLGRLMYNVGAPLAQAANTHSHHPHTLLLSCRHTDMANLIARLSPRVSFSTGAFQLLPEPASIY